MWGPNWRRLSVAILTAIAFLAPLSVGAEPPATPAATTEQAVTGDVLLSVSARILEATNQTRAQHGVGPLQPVSYLAEAATGHSQEMMELGYFGHVSPTPGRAQPKMRIQLARGWDTRTGENIFKASGIPAAQLAERAMTAWINSPSHFKNLVEPTFNSIGIGIASRGDEWTITQNFSNQTIVVRHLKSEAAPGGYKMTLRGQVREGSDEGALFVNNVFQQTFTADADGVFILQATAPAGAQISVSQKKPGSKSYAQTLLFPIEAGL